MIKHLITATSFALGGAGVVLVGYLSVKPLPFTRPVAELPSMAASPAAAPAAIALETNHQEIVLPDVRITASRRSARVQKVLPARLDPCSAWSEVGAIFIDPGGATGVRQVRALCATPSNER